MKLAYFLAMRHNHRNLSLAKLLKYKPGAVLPISKKDLEVIRGGGFLVTHVNGEYFQVGK